MSATKRQKGGNIRRNRSYSQSDAHFCFITRLSHEPLHLFVGFSHQENTVPLQDLHSCTQEGWIPICLACKKYILCSKDLHFSKKSKLKCHKFTARDLFRGGTNKTSFDSCTQTICASHCKPELEERTLVTAQTAAVPQSCLLRHRSGLTGKNGKNGLVLLSQP